MSRIQSAPGVSRADLARSFGLSEMAAARIARELLAADLIEEREATGRKRRRALGRPSIGLVLRPKGLFAAGITVSAYRSEASISDANGKLVARRPVEDISFESVATAARSSAAALVRLIEDAPIDPRRIVGVGVALSARTEPDRKEIVKSEYFGWKNDGGQFAALIERSTGLPVQIESLGNALALSEMRFGSARGLTDFVLVHVATFAGLGIVSEGRLVRGASGMAGQIGHVRAREKPMRCVCGRNDCTNLSATGFGLLAALGRLDHDHFDHARLPYYARSLLEIIDTGKSDVALARAGEQLFPALDAACTLLGPERVILSGYLGANPAYFAGADREMARMAGDRAVPRLRGGITAIQAAPLLALDAFGYSDRLDFDRFAALSAGDGAAHA